jgi:archaellum component FlaC
MDSFLQFLLEHVGDGSLLTNIPAPAGFLTVSNLLNAVSTNVTTVSTNINTVSNLVNAVSTNVTTLSTNLNTVSNLVNAVSTNVTTVSTNLNTVSNLINAVSTNVTTVSTNLNTVSNNVSFLLTVSNISAITLSTTYGFFSTISAGTVFGRFIGDGSQLTNIPASASILTVSNLVNAVSTNVTTVSTNVNTVSNLLNAVSTNVTTLSTNVNTVSNLLNAVSTNVTTVSTNLNTVSNNVSFLLAVSNISAITLSTSYGFFSTISAGTVFGRFIGDGSQLTNIPASASILTVSNLVNAVSTNVTTVSTNLNTVSNIVNAVSTNVTTVSTNLNTVSNTVNFLLAVSNISAITLSTSYGFFSTISAGTVYGKHVGDGSLLTNIPAPAGFLTVSNLVNAVSTNVTTVSTNVNTVSNLLNVVSTNVTTVSTNLNTVSNLVNAVSTNVTTVSTNLNTVSNTVNFLLAVSNISAITLSTSYGFFSTISAGTFFGRFIGDGSQLTNIPASASIITVSNLVNAVSTNVTTVSTNVNTVSNLLNVVSTNVTTVSTNLNTVSNLVNAVSTNFTTVSTNLNTVSNLLNAVSTNVTTVSTNINSVSNTVNFLLAVSNISAITLSTSYGFFSTISAGAVFGRFIGDASLLTSIPNNGAILAVSNNVTTVSNLLNSVSTNVTNVSTNLNTVSNLLNSVSTNTTTISTNLNTVSNTVNFLLAVSNISATTMSTSYGFFSTISAGTVFGRFIGDASLLTGIPTTAGLLAVSNLLNAVSTNVTTVSTNLNTVSNLVNAVSTNVTIVSTTVNFLLTVSNISAASISTSYGFFSTISAGTVFGKFVGDGSLLTNLPVAGVTSILSTQAFYVSTISTGNITSIQGYISSLRVDSLQLGTGDGWADFGPLRATAISTLQVTTGSLTTGNLQVGLGSSLSYIAFPGLQQGYNQSVVAEQSTGTGTQELLLFRGSTTTDRIRMQTTGSIVFETGVGARIFPAVGSNVTPAMIITTSSNVGIGVLAPTTTLDVGGTGRFQILSSQQLYTSSVSAGIVYGKFMGDGSGLTGITSGGGISIVPPILSTTLLSTGLLTASNISTATISTNYGFFSTLSAGTIYGKFVGDGSGLTGITSGGGISIVPPILSTTLLSTGLLTASNISAATISTNYGFFSTLSSGTIYAKFVGDGSLLTNVPFSLSQNISVNSISTNTISTSVGFASSFTIGMLSLNTATVQNGLFSSISTGQGYISSLRVDSLQIGLSTGYINMGDLITTTLSSGSVRTGNISSGSATISSLSAGTAYIGNLTGSQANFSSISTAIAWIGQATISSISANTINSGTAFISSLRTSEVRASTVTAAVLSSFIVYASSINTPNIYVTNIYANDGGIANVVASSLNASRAVFVQVIASSFQGALIGTNLLAVQTL